MNVNFIKEFKRIVDYLLFPSNGQCPICRRILFFTNDFICLRCREKIQWIVGDRCEKCGKPIPYEYRHYCSDCLKSEHIFESGIAMFIYEEYGKELIHNIKFFGNKDLGEWSGKILGEFLKDISWINEIENIIPVPLHENRLKDRGFNQAKAIAKGVSDILEIKILENALSRIIDTPHQIGLHRKERIKNIKNAFKVINKEVIKGKNILIIDDVYTTGATIDACARKLIQAGAAKVYFATLATGKNN